MFGSQMTSPEDKVRDEIFYKNRSRLCELATRAVFTHEKTPDQVAVIVVQADDPYWGQLANTLMPDADWDAIRAQGMEPLARGSVEWSTVEFICEVCPDVSQLLRREPTPGTLYGIVCAENGVAVYEVPYTGGFEA